MIVAVGLRSGLVQDRIENRIKHLSNRSQPKFVSLNCQSGKYQSVLIARAFTHCVKIGLMRCQFCGVRSSMFEEIGSKLPGINFDHCRLANCNQASKKMGQPMEESQQTCMQG